MSNAENETAKVAAELHEFLESMVIQQRAKVQKIANRINPRLTEDDIMDSPSFPELHTHPQFSYEDGLLAGLIAAQVAIHREFSQKIREAGGEIKTKTP